MDTPKDADARKDEEVTSTPPMPESEEISTETTATKSADETTAIPAPVTTSTSTELVSTPTQQPTAPTASPATAPLAEASAQAQNNPITLVLQWLTYAFWGWFALSILWLSAITIAFLVVGAESSDWSVAIAYPIAAVVVLFLVAGVVDFFYSRVEPARKQGVGTAIMVIHAVLFALCGIGAVIGAVFALINLLLSSGGSEISKATLTSLYVSLVMIFVYALLIVRTVLVAKVRRISWITTGVLGGLALLFIILGVVGPVAQSILTRQDRELESVLPQVPSVVTEYAQENNKLPASLNELSFESLSKSSEAEAKSVVSKGIIKYTPNIKEPARADSINSLNGTSGAKVSDLLYKLPGNTTYYYRLCVTWQAEKNYDDRTVPYPVEDLSAGSSASPSYDSYISAYSHKKGEQCYNLEASVYDK